MRLAWQVSEFITSEGFEAACGSLKSLDLAGAVVVKRMKILGKESERANERGRGALGFKRS